MEMRQTTEIGSSAINNPQSAITNHKPKRPFSVTLVALAVLTIAVIHLMRLVGTVQQWEFLASLSNSPGLPVYQALTGLAWALAAFPLAWVLWRGWRRAPAAVRFFLPAYLLYAWIDRLFVASPAVTLHRDASWPFMIGATLVSIAFILWVFSRSKVKSFFRRDA